MVRVYSLFYAKLEYKKRLSENTDNKEGNKINSYDDCNNQIFHYTWQLETAVFFCRPKGGDYKCQI